MCWSLKDGWDLKLGTTFQRAEKRQNKDSKSDGQRQRKEPRKGVWYSSRHEGSHVGVGTFISGMRLLSRLLSGREAQARPFLEESSGG